MDGSSDRRCACRVGGMGWARRATNMKKKKTQMTVGLGRCHTSITGEPNQLHSHVKDVPRAAPLCVPIRLSVCQYSPSSPLPEEQPPKAERLFIPRTTSVPGLCSKAASWHQGPEDQSQLCTTSPWAPSSAPVKKKIQFFPPTL